MKTFPIVLIATLIVGVTATAGWAQNERALESSRVVELGGVAKQMRVVSADESRKMKFTPIPTPTSQIVVGHGWQCLPPTERIPFERCTPYLIFCPTVGDECVVVE